LILDLFTPPAAIADAGKKPDTLVVRDSFRRLAREIGITEGGAALKAIRKSVERLFGVTVFVQSGKRRVGMRLLSAYASDEGTGDLFVALNPRLAGGRSSEITSTSGSSLPRCAPWEPTPPG